MKTGATYYYNIVMCERLNPHGIATSSLVNSGLLAMTKIKPPRPYGRRCLAPPLIFFKKNEGSTHKSVRV